MATEIRFPTAAILEFLAREFHGSFRDVSTDVVIGVAAAELVPINYDRVGLTMINLGGSDVIVRPGPSPTLTSGIRLGAGGGNVTLSVREDQILPGLQWSGISSVAGQTVFVLQVVREVRNPQG